MPKPFKTESCVIFTLEISMDFIKKHPMQLVTWFLRTCHCMDKKIAQGLNSNVFGPVPDSDENQGHAFTTRHFCISWFCF